MGRQKGYKHSPETIQKMREKKACCVFTPEHRAKLSEAAKKRGINKTWRQHMIEGRKKLFLTKKQKKTSNSI